MFTTTNNRLILEQAGIDLYQTFARDDQCFICTSFQWDQDFFQIKKLLKHRIVPTRQKRGKEKEVSTCNALWNKSNGSYDIKDFGTLPLIFSTSKYFRRKFQPCPSFFSHPNIPDKWKRLPLSLDQMKKKEKVKVKS